MYKKGLNKNLKDYLRSRPFIGAVSAVLVAGSILGYSYFTKPQKTIEDIKQPGVEITVSPYEGDTDSLDKIIRSQPEKQIGEKKSKSFESVKVNPYNPETIDRAMQVMDYSAISGADEALVKNVKRKLKDILSSEWCLKKYPEAFSQLSKFDDVLTSSRNYAIITQEMGVDAILNGKRAVSSKGATGYGQLMDCAKGEQAITSTHAIDESFDPLKGNRASAAHLIKYGFSELEKLAPRLGLDLAVYNWGVGNVSAELANIIESRGEDPTEIFLYSRNNKGEQTYPIIGLKNPEKLDDFNLSYDQFRAKLPLQTKNYIENVSALQVFLENIKMGKFENINFENLPNFSEMFTSKALNAGENPFRLYKEHAQQYGISWQQFQEFVNPHILNSRNLPAGTTLYVPKEVVSPNYFPERYSSS